MVMHLRPSHLLHFTLKRNLSEIYWTIFLRVLAISLIGIFVPIYFLEVMGVSFSQLLIYRVFVYLFVIIGFFVTAFLGSRIGFPRVIMISFPLHIIFYLLLYNFETFPVSIYFIGALLGFQGGLFWLSYHVDFAKFSDRKHRGEEVKFLYVVASFIGIIGPLAGGFLLHYYGFSVVFFIVIILFLFGTFPLIKLGKIKDHYEFSLKEVFRKDHFSNAPLYLIQGMRHLTNDFFWPILVFYLLKDYLSLGLIFSGAAIFSSFIVWFVGNEVDKMNRRTFARFSSFIDGFVLLIKSVVGSFFQVLGIAALGGVTHAAAEISFNAVAYDQPHKKHIVGFFVLRELMFNVTRISLLFIIFFAGLGILNGVRLAFILVGVAALIEGVFYKEKSLH